MTHPRYPRWLELALAVVLAAGLTACGDGHRPSPESCAPGATEACACPTGPSVRECVDGTFGPCPCAGSADASVPEDASAPPSTPPGCTTDCGGPQAPRVLSWALSSMVLKPSQSISISAVLTDPDGVDDVLGGTLLDREGRAYGTFTTTAAEGSYGLTLTWDGVNDVEPITYDGGTLRRSLVARFFDVAGHEVERAFDVSLECDDAARSPCAGRCRDLQSSLHNCGACGFGCVSPSTGSSSANHCIDGYCINSLPHFDADRDLSCEERCAELGHVCDEGVVSGPIGYANYYACDGRQNLTSCTDVAPVQSSCSGQPTNRTWFECYCWRHMPWGA